MPWSDEGSEFVNKHFKDFLDKNGIKLYHTENEEKSSIVERWNKTMKKKCLKCLVRITILFIGINLMNWLMITRHSSIKMTPLEASKKRK